MQVPSPNPSSSPAGRQKEWSIDSFCIESHVSDGSYGSVYKARLKSTGEHFALKEISKAKAVKHEAVERVFAEKNIHLQLKHPNIARLWGTFQTECCVYFVLEWAEGGDLSDFWRLHRDRPAAGSPGVAAAIAIGVLAALQACHLFGGGGGVLHRDLKPENVLVGAQTTVKLGDFGCACFVDDFLEGRAPLRNVGSASYASPHLLMLSPDPSAAASASPASRLCRSWRWAVSVDLWSFGCLVHFLKHGVSPFWSPASDYLSMQMAVDFLAHPCARTVLSPDLDRLLFLGAQRGFWEDGLENRLRMYKSIENGIREYFMTH